MSQENVDLVRTVYESFLSADFESALAMIDEAVVWDLSHHNWPGPERYHGHAGVMEVLTEWMGSFEDYRVEVEDVKDGGDRVVAIQHETAIHKESRAGIDRRTASIYTIRDSRVIRIDNYLEPSDALEAAGLSE